MSNYDRFLKKASKELFYSGDLFRTEDLSRSKIELMENRQVNFRDFIIFHFPFDRSLIAIGEYRILFSKGDRNVSINYSQIDSLRVVNIDESGSVVKKESISKLKIVTKDGCKYYLEFNKPGVVMSIFRLVKFGRWLCLRTE